MAASRLLLVDDEESSRRTFCEILTRAGYDVVTAASGEEGVAVLRQGGPHIDLILTDLRMPGASGFEVLAAARACAAAVPAVMYSAYATNESEAIARQLGAADFLSGPVWAADLLGAVERQLQRAAPAVAGAAGPASSSPARVAMRWAVLLVPVVHLQDDVPTVERWSKVVGKSTATLRARSGLVDVHADDSLDLARGLRVTVQHEGQVITPLEWYEHFDVLDHRTLERLLDRGALSAEGRIPSARAFLRHQHFITDPRLIAALSGLLGISA